MNESRGELTTTAAYYEGQTTLEEWSKMDPETVKRLHNYGYSHDGPIA